MDSDFPHLSVSVTLGAHSEGARFGVHSLSEETVILAIKNDLQQFEAEMERLKNSPLTEDERSILKAYLWWRTKNYFQDFNREIGGLKIYRDGTVRLVAVDVRISHINQDSGLREFDNTVKLSELGEEYHSELVRSWDKWNQEYRMVLFNTTVEDGVRRTSLGVISMEHGK